MSDIRKYFLSTYQALTNLVYGGNAKAKDSYTYSLPETSMYSYIPVYTDGLYSKVHLDDYFRGDKNDSLLKTIEHFHNPSRWQDRPLFSNLYDASRYLSNGHGARRREARYILVINGTEEKALKLLKEGKNFYHNIVGALNHEDLIKFIINKNSDPTLPESFEKLNLFENKNIEYVKNELASFYLATNKSEPNCLIL